MNLLFYDYTRRKEFIKACEKQTATLMAHESILTSNPNFESVLNRMSEEGLDIEDALRELSERSS